MLVFKEDEEKPSWKAGRSVAYCEACFREKMEKEAENEVSGQESEASTSISVSSRSSGGKSLQSKAKYPRKRYVLALQVRWRCQIRGFLFYTDTVGFLDSVLICFLQERKLKTFLYFHTHLDCTKVSEGVFRFS